METFYIQGRSVAPAQLHWMRRLISGHPEWGRFRLSVHIAEQWNWRNAAGQLKDMAARTLLLKLERRGLLQLPRRQRGGGSRKARPPQGDQLEQWTEPLIQARLSQLLPLQLGPVDSSRERQRLASLLGQYHYLGYRRPIGENLQYLARDRSARPLACLVFGAAAWQCAPRDQYIGWGWPARKHHLHLVANNMRLLVLPWVQVQQLASHLLGLVAQRINADWQRKYGHPIYLLESFVQPDRFQGHCYGAAHWICAGQTQGRSRNDPEGARPVPCKDVYLYPLTRPFRSALQNQPHQPAPCGKTLSNDWDGQAKSFPQPPSFLHPGSA